jgi:hypothetical protein
MCPTLFLGRWVVDGVGAVEKTGWGVGGVVDGWGSLGWWVSVRRVGVGKIWLAAAALAVEGVVLVWVVGVHVWSWVDAVVIGR